MPVMWSRSKILIVRFARDEDGATAIEYALIAGCISIAIVGAVTSIGSSVYTNLYEKVRIAFEAANVGG